MHYHNAKMTKGQIDPIKLIILFVIIGIVAAVLLFWFNDAFGKEIDIVDDRLDSLDDQDNDGKPDFIRGIFSDESETGDMTNQENDTTNQER